jgi:hypothetical protein
MRDRACIPVGLLQLSIARPPMNRPLPLSWLAAVVVVVVSLTHFYF